jgi:biopolymer transport protein ExbD
MQKPLPRRSFNPQPPELSMTPMIDVVFQLLVFFLFTFRPIVHEGQFDIYLSPPGAAVPTDLPALPPLAIQLIADGQGNLQGIRLGEAAMRSLEELTAEVATLTRGGALEDLEAEIRADAHLKYTHVIATVNALTRAGVGRINFGPLRPQTPAQ